MTPVTVQEGEGPLILGMPHTGTTIPDALLSRLNDRGRLLADTDWHIDRLYDGLVPTATVVRATFHRYVIDANRDPSGASLYPGQNTTGLCPEIDFDGHPIWRPGETPGSAEIAERLATFHIPYHKALSDQIERVHARYGIAVLYDCHSIRSRIPYLFDGVLPDFNIGTNKGTTCGSVFEEAAVAVCDAAEGYTTVLNGRFKGGWTTRRYGQPRTGRHAIQMELAQATHLETETPPFAYSADRAARLRLPLQALLSRIERLALDRAS